jgi:acyl phosphate:glycerol-3-phosphate acyltransferase
MIALLRTFHVLSVALWFGSVAFFTVAGVLIFRAYERESLKPAGDRPAWFPLPQRYDREPPPDSNFPDPLRKEQGSRAAGVAVSELFPVYFALQAGCGAAALLTAVGLALLQGGFLNAVRLIVCLLALASALGGWWLERRVHGLRDVRSERTDAVLESPAPTDEQIAEAKEARAEFGKWHGISLLVNFATLGLTLAAAALAGHYRPSST